ncbi:cysteine dioxygenase [Tenacibaculum ovolyticum]|uniref:cysteine dioxygenase n=1 Tax=Tenacibaculum ovolyticum TaxID=104270 RepID=UPI001F1A6B0B|nr:cysteine dioxygenase family protein [Tenacibaculum ovolyticum]
MNSNNHTPVIIQTLEELVAALSEGESTTYNHIIHLMELSADIFDDYTSWSKESYTRNCIINNEKFELILLCWEQGQITPIHDHGGEECWVKVINGEFREKIYKENDVGELNVTKTTISRVNEVTYMKDFMGFHSLENISNKRSMSLHLYAKPIRKCRTFDEENKKFINRKLTYCTTV